MALLQVTCTRQGLKKSPFDDAVPACKQFLMPQFLRHGKDLSDFECGAAKALLLCRRLQLEAGDGGRTSAAETAEKKKFIKTTSIEIRDFRSPYNAWTRSSKGVNDLWARAFYSCCGFPFTAIDNKAFRHAVGETAKLGRFYLPPERHAILQKGVEGRAN